jgi:rhodanese-related sulfurtransferase
VAGPGSNECFFGGLEFRPLSTAEGTDRGPSALQYHHNLPQHTVDRGARENPRNAGLATYMTLALRSSRRTPYEYGGMMSWNMFSRFGAGSDPNIVSFGDLAEAVGTHAWTIVDVREPHEFAAGHVPNALNMPMSSYDPKDLPEGKPVVLICQSGGRSRNALNKARTIGREDVRHFAEGMNGWRSHNGPVTL